MQDQYNLSGANDTLYSMFGVLSKLQKLSDSYVLMGELRGDLMTVSDKSDRYLKEINNFEMSSANPYAANATDYYAVVNNCNYIIHNIDTSVVKGSKKVLLREYAAVKAIRAWTYMQIAQNFGSVTYYSQPLLKVEDADKYKDSVLTMEQLAPRLVADILPYKDVDQPSLGAYFTVNSSYSLFPIRFLLGDLYLWMGTYSGDKNYYALAAAAYQELIYNKSYRITAEYKSTIATSNNAFTGLISSNSWGGLFISPSSSEDITSIIGSNQYTHYFHLDSLAESASLSPSSAALNNWSSQKYYYSYYNATGKTIVIDTLADARAAGSVLSLTQTVGRNTTVTYNLIYKLISMDPISLINNNTYRRVMPYRVGLLYLRLAEALNRLGKPNTALAILKNGLNNSSLSSRKIIPLSEIADSLTNPFVVKFRDSRFSSNIGIRSRGLGAANIDTLVTDITKDSRYIIPNATKLTQLNTDTITYVEDLIVDELALETAFEGNRFSDLMRIAIRRNSPSFLADKVVAKFTTNKETIRTTLLNMSNWYYHK
jgi:SusD family.